MNEEEAKARLRLIQIQKEKAARASSQPAPAEPEGNLVRDTQGFGGRLLKGLTLGAGDEIAGASRAALEYLSPDAYGEDAQSFGDKYRMYRDDSRRADSEFQENYPKTSFAADVVSSLASPVNKIAPGFGSTGTFLPRAVQATARGGAEGAVFGFNEGTGDIGDRLSSAATGATVGAGSAGALNVLGGGLGRALSKRRVEADLVQPDGSQMPIHLASPDTGLGRFYRDWMASIPYAKGALREQEAPFLERAAQETAGQQAVYDQDAANLARHQWHRQNDIELDTQRASSELQRQIDAEKLAAQRTQDLNATRNAQRTAEEQAAAEAAAIASRNTLNLRTLRESVPEGRREAITDTGFGGFRQALGEINAAYDDAWGSVSGLAKNTLPVIQNQIEFKVQSLPTDAAATLRRLSQDVEKLGEADNVAGLDDKLRRMIDSATDYQLRGDLKELRETLRLGLPDENLAKLNEVDKVYPAFLTVQKAAAKADDTRGVPSADQLLSSATSVAGERRAALGQQPLLDTIYQGRPLPQAPTPTTVVPKAPALERTLGLAQAKREAAAKARELKKAAAVIAADEKKQLKARGETGPLAKAKAAQETLERAKATPHNTVFSSLASAGALGSLATGGLVPYGVGLGVGIGTARALSTKGGQRVVAGQTGLQKELAEAMRKGDTAKYTQLLSRYAAGQATGE